MFNVAKLLKKLMDIEKKIDLLLAKEEKPKLVKKEKGNK